MPTHKTSFAIIAVLRAFVKALSCTDNGYSMYVWTSRFNASAPHCSGVYPVNKNGDNAPCFKHNCDTSASRQELWASCSQPGREVTRLFVSDINSRIEYNGYNASGSCDTDVILLLGEAHHLGIRVYALFAVSDSDFSESYRTWRVIRDNSMPAVVMMKFILMEWQSTMNTLRISRIVIMWRIFHCSKVIWIGCTLL
ncbi:hypothetical protein ACHAXN_007199 [Cyclotella atomus]